MSSRHFEILNCGEYAEVRDLNSTNKTWVNNGAITNAKLSSGDTLRAGKTIFGLEWESPVPVVETRCPPELPVKVEIPEPEPRHRNESPISSSFVFFAPNSPVQAKEPAPVASEEFNPVSSSPIESLDATFEEPKFDDSIGAFNKNPFVPQQSYSLPLDEESIHFGASPVVTEESKSRERKIRRGQLNQSIDFYRVISRLSENHDTTVVVHFKKIGMLTPSSIFGIPVFSDIPNTEQYMPIMVDGKEWLRTDPNSFTPRLSATDGIMLFFAAKHGSFDRLRSLSLQAIPGITESGGFLGWCWPSQWHDLSENDSHLECLLGETIEGVIYPWKNKIWAQFTSQVSDEMRSIGFGD